jgi:hypothetical protein
MADAEIGSGGFGRRFGARCAQRFDADDEPIARRFLLLWTCRLCSIWRST